MTTLCGREKKCKLTKSSVRRCKQPPKVAIIVRTVARSMVSSCSDSARSQWHPNASQWPTVRHSSSPPLHTHTHPRLWEGGRRASSSIKYNPTSNSLSTCISGPLYRYEAKINCQNYHSLCGFCRLFMEDLEERTNPDLHTDIPLH